MQGNSLPKFFRKEKIEILSWFQRQKQQPLLMLWGPRQCGKTTLIQQALTDHHGPSQYINVDEYNDEEALIHNLQLHHIDKAARIWLWINQHWETARLTAKQKDCPFVLVIDEVQKIENWSQRVKGLWDKDRWNNHIVHVVLLESSPHLLQKGLSESLSGRFHQIFMKHWSYNEMHTAFGIHVEEYIFYGGYPSSAKYIGDETQWRKHIIGNIVEANLKRDVLGLMDISEPALLEHIYTLGAQLSSQILSYAKILEDYEGTAQGRVKEYLRMLSEVSLLTGLMPYSHSLIPKGSAIQLQV